VVYGWCMSGGRWCMGGDRWCMGGVMWCVSGVWIKAYYSRVACMYKGGIFCYIRSIWCSSTKG
jgi:hypothetical protein